MSAETQETLQEPVRISGRMVDTSVRNAETDGNSQKLIGRWISVTIVAATAVVGLVVLRKTTHHPRTDDAAVLANYIGIAPQVEGPLVRLPAQDNQFVKRANCCLKSTTGLTSTRSKERFRNRQPSKVKSPMKPVESLRSRARCWWLNPTSAAPRRK
jgi:hypothetical protein